MAFTDTFDTATPAGGDTPTEADDRMREIKAAIQERENVDHYWPLTGTEVSDEDAGEHRKVTLRTGAAPTKADDKGILYAKDVSGKVELFYIDEDGDEVQITTGGEIRAASIEAGSLIPPGAITAFGAAAAPTGWVLCDGTAYSRTVTYDTLFGVIGTTYGVGDGATTFNVPDLRGRVPVGLDAANVNLDAADALAEAGGDENSEAHTHFVANSDREDDDDLNASRQMAFRKAEGNATDYRLRGTATAATIGKTSETGTGSGENLQPFLTINYIIKI